MNINESDQQQYMEGQIRGLRMFQAALIRGITSSLRSTASDIDFRIIVRDSLNEIIANIDAEARFNESPFFQGIRKVFEETRTELLGE